MTDFNFLFIGFADAANGAATFFRSLIDNKSKFEEDGDGCRFYCQKRAKVDSNDDIYIDTPPLHIKIRSLLSTISKYSYLLTLLVFDVFLLRHARRVVKQIDSVCNQDVWFFNDIFVAYYFIKKFPDAKKLSLVLHNDGDPSKMILSNYPKLSQSMLKTRIESEVLFILKKLDNIVFLSANSLDRFDEKYSAIKFKGKKMVISNGVELPFVARTRAKDHKIVGVSVGSINRRKGYDMLISAVDQINKDNVNIEINCIGDLSDLSLIKRANSVDNINFVGPQSREDIAQFLANADFFILCSREEGMPMSIIEAMQYKLPVFVTNVGAIGQMFTTMKEGVLVEPTVEGIYNTLLQIGQRKYDLEKMGMFSGEKYESSYTTTKMIAEYLKLLKS